MTEETIFNAEFNVDANTEQAQQSIDALAKVISEFSEKTEGALGNFGKKLFGAALAGGVEHASMAIDDLVLKTNQLETEVTDSASAFKLMYEAPKRGLTELVGLSRVGLRAIGDENGELIKGFGLLFGALREGTRHIEPLSGIHNFLDTASATINKFIPRWKVFSSLLGQSDTTRASLSVQSRERANSLQLQTRAWKAQQAEQLKAFNTSLRYIDQMKELIRHIRRLQDLQKRVKAEGMTEAVFAKDYALKQDLKAAGAQISSLDVAGKSIEYNIGRIVSRVQQLRGQYAEIRSAHKETFSTLELENFRQKITSTSAAVGELNGAEQVLQKQVQLRSTAQKHIAGEITKQYNAMAHALRFVESTYRSTGKISERYLARQRVAANGLLRLFDMMKRAGGEVPVEMAQNYNRLNEILKAFEIEAKRVNRLEKKRSDDLVQRTSRIRKFIDTIRGATGAITKYSKETQQASMQNRMLMQYVQPRGIINSGITQIGARATRSSLAVQQFSMSLGSIIGMAGAVGGALGQIDPAFSALIVGASRFADQMSRSFSALLAVTGTTAQKVKAAMAIISNSLMGFSLMATGTIIKTGLLAAEVKTLEITMRQIARNLAKDAGGNMDAFAEHVVALRDEIVATGISTKEATNALTQFLRAQLPVERVSELADAAKNLGVTVANMSSSEVFGRFIYFIQSGNSALLKMIGINKTAQQMYDDYSKVIGKKVNTTEEKRLALIEGIIAATQTVTGVYDEAQKTAGKQLSSMKRLFEEFMLTIGRRFEPVLAVLIKGLNSFFKWFNNLSPAIHDNIAAVIKWTAVWGGLLGMIMAFIPAVRALIPLVKLLGKSLLTAMPWLIAIAAAIATISAVVKGFKKLWNANFAGIQDSVKELVDVFKTELGPIIDEIKHWWQGIKEEWDRIIYAIAIRLKEFVRNVANFLRRLRTEWADEFQSIKNVIYGFMSFIRFALKGINAILRGDSKKGTEYVKHAFLNLFAAIGIIVKRWISKAFTWGWNLIVEFANGIMKAAQQAVVAAVTWVGNVISNFFAAFSPPKKGPLSHIVEWGKGLMDTYLRAFALADFGVLKDVMAPIKDALKDAAAAGTIDEKDYVPKIQVVRKHVAQLIKEFRESGKINENTFKAISDQLGEGGKDYMEYIRRVLDHQKALRKLEDVRKRVGEAQSAGFVSQELQEELSAAEKEVKIREEAVNWQKEYLAAMKETVDLQLQQLKTLEKIAKSLKGVAGKEGDVGEEFEFKLPEEFKQTVSEELDEVGKSLGYVSIEFFKMRDQIEKWLALPIEGKVKSILKWFLQLSEVPLPDDWDTMSLAEQIKTLFNMGWEELKRQFGLWKTNARLKIQEWWDAFKKGLAAKEPEEIAGKPFGTKLRYYFDKGLEFFTEKRDEYVTGISTTLQTIWDDAVTYLKENFRPSVVALSEWYNTVLYEFLKQVTEEEELENSSELVASAIGKIFGKAIDLIGKTISLPVRLQAWFIKQIIDFIALIVEDLDLFSQPLAETWAKILARFILWMDEHGFDAQFIEDLVNWFGGIVTAFISGILDSGPEWLVDLAKFAALIYTTLKEAFEGLWNGEAGESGILDWFVGLVVEWFKGVLAIQDFIDAPKSVGKAIVDNLKAGIKSKWSELTAWWGRKLGEIANKLPFSEPKDRTSPLYGLGKSGAALVENFAEGFKAADLAGVVNDSLGQMRLEANNMAQGRNSYYQYGAFYGAFPNVQTRDDAVGVMDVIDERASRAKYFSHLTGE